MDYSLADYAAQMDPMERQAMVASLLRRRQQSGALEQANQQASQFSNLAAIAQMANNKSAASAAQAADKSAQARYSPIQLGTQGFQIPGTGEFIPSPIYEDEQRARRDATAENARSRIQASQDALQARLADQQRRDEENRTLRKTLFEMGEQGRNSRHQDLLGIRQQLADLKANTADKGKVLPGSEVRGLSQKEGVAGGFADLVTSFKDEYGGSPMLAKTQNVLGKYQPLGMGSRYEDQANWWQNYNEQKNAIRHSLFGSALTLAEQQAFDAANIVEGMEAKQIRERLRQQAAMAARAYNKLRANFGNAGYDVSSFQDVIEPTATLPGHMPPGQQVPGLNLPPGHRVIGVQK
jgi:hypothetical protein